MCVCFNSIRFHCVNNRETVASATGNRFVPCFRSKQCAAVVRSPGISKQNFKVYSANTIVKRNYRSKQMDCFEHLQR